MRKFLVSALMLATFAVTAGAQTAATDSVKAERMFGYVLNDQPDSLYAGLSDRVKGMVKPEQLKGIKAAVESQFGKYKSHGPWSLQDVMGVKAQVCDVVFEKKTLCAVVVFGDDGKAMGVQMLPSEAIKK